MSNWRRYSTFLFGCLSIVSCAGEPEVAAVPAASSSLISTELLAATWPVRMSEDKVRLPFEQDPAWGQVFRREYPEALGAFAAAAPTGRALARMHVEHAALYRQAALLAANSVRQVYGADRQDVDPVEVDYLLAASAGVMGDCAGARAALLRLQGANAALLGPQTAFLQAWADAPDCPRVPGGADVGVGAFPGQRTAAKAGTIPDVEALPHYRFTEKVEGGGELSATKLSTTWWWVRLDSNQGAREEEVEVSAGCAGGSGLATSWRQMEQRRGHLDARSIAIAVTIPG